VKRPHTFAMESVRRGSAYYDYENNVNVVPRYLSANPAMEAITPARERSAGASTARCSRR
jgi:hypothetical protein